MKKKLIASMTASVLIAASAMTQTALAGTNIRDLFMNPSYQSVIMPSAENEWTIDEEGVAMIDEDLAADGGIYSFRIALKEDYNDSMGLYFSFRAGEKSYDVLYLLMLAEQEMYIPVKNVVEALIDRYPDEEIPYKSIDSIVVSDPAGLVDSVSFVRVPDEFPELAGSVLLSYSEDENGEYTVENSYYIFDKDGGSGRTMDTEMGIGLPFMYEQNGGDIMFHFASADDNTPAKFEFDSFRGAIFGEFEYGDTTRKMKFRLVNTDETSGFLSLEGGKRWELLDPAERLMDASGTAGGSVGLIVEFDRELDKGFDLDFEYVEGSGGRTQKVSAYHSKPLASNTVFIRVRDLLGQMDADTDNVISFEVVNNGKAAVKSVRFGMGSPDYADMLFGTAEPAVSAGSDDTNPHTGAGLAPALLLSAAAGITAVASRKRR